MSAPKLPSAFRRKHFQAASGQNNNLQQQKQQPQSKSDEAVLVARHYDNRPNKSIEERRQSEIIGLKSFNNWLKSVLIRQYTKKGNHVLDVGIGKGGDLIKYSYSEIFRLVGIDIARKSLDDAVERYNSSIGRCRYSLKLICGDCTKVTSKRKPEEEEEENQITSNQIESNQIKSKKIKKVSNHGCSPTQRILRCHIEPICYSL